MIQRAFSDSHQSLSSPCQVLFSMYVQTTLAFPERHNFVTESPSRERNWYFEVLGTSQGGFHPQFEMMLSLLNFPVSIGGPL